MGESTPRSQQRRERERERKPGWDEHSGTQMRTPAFRLCLAAFDSDKAVSATVAVFVPRREGRKGALC